jgi:hypothetical protein
MEIPRGDLSEEAGERLYLAHPLHAGGVATDDRFAVSTQFAKLKEHQWTSPAS